MKKLSKKDKEKLIAWLKTGKNGKSEVYWDYDQQLMEDQIMQIVEGNLNDVENSIFDNNIDYIQDIEREIINTALKVCELSEKYEVSDIWDDLVDYTMVDLNFEQLLKNTKNIPVRITLYSNYDCINSHYFEQSSGGYGNVQTYFGHMVKELKLNPAKVKEKFIAHGDKMYGKWQNIPQRNGKEYVDYGQFYVEMENQCCGACNLIIVGLMNLRDFIKGKPKEIIIPKGNYVGMYSTMNGGGSPIETPLLRDMKIDLTKKFPTQYDYWRLETDTPNWGYTINNAYGVTKEFWGKQITIKSYVKDEQANIQS